MQLKKEKEAEQKQETQDLRSRTKSFNQSTQKCWETFASHRQRITNLLRSTSGKSPRSLSVLGAGNCNDLDLSELYTCFPRIHLVDIDMQAITEGVKRQKVETYHGGQIFLHGGVDVTGIFSWLDKWISGNPPATQDFLNCIDHAKNGAVALPSPVDVAVSVGLLSPIMEVINLALGNHPQKFTQLAATVRARHLELLVNSVRPGGRAIVITDITSSEMVPELISSELHELPDLLNRAIKDGKILTGVNPFNLLRICKEIPSLATRVEEAKVSHPWLWHYPNRTYLACAVEIKRSLHS